MRKPKTLSQDQVDAILASLLGGLANIATVGQVRKSVSNYASMDEWWESMAGMLHDMRIAVESGEVQQKAGLIAADNAPGKRKTSKQVVQ